MGDATEYIYADTIGGSGSLITKRYSFWNYSAANRILNDSEYSIAPANYKYYYTYDASGYKIQDSLYNFVTSMPGSKIVYTNNAGGQPVNTLTYIWSSGSWAPTYQTNYTYDVYGHQTSAIAQTYSVSAWVNVRKDTAYYPGASNRYTLTAVFFWASGMWEPSTVYKFTINTSNQWDTLYYFSWNTTASAFDTAGRQYMTYDAYGNLKYTGIMDYSYVTHTYADTATDLNTYYYEIYNDGLIVNNAALSSPGVDIFPNPVSNTLHLAIEGLPDNSKAKVTITNIIGQAIVSGEVANGNNEINISTLSGGIYIVSVTSNELHYTQRIVKYNR